MLSDVIHLLNDHNCQPKRSGAGWSARCPSHDDKAPSLSVSENSEGAVLIHCHAGCTTERVCEALGLALVDLAPPQPARREIVATYDYHTATGSLAYQVVRFDPKTFRQRRPDGHDGWIWNLQGVDRVLYHLPAVTAAIQAGEAVWIAEGEKDADTLTKAGITATTNPGGADKWQDAYSHQLAGGNIIVVADRDEAGRKHAERIKQSLTNVAASVILIEAAHGKDATDHIQHGLGLADFRPLTLEDSESPSPNGDTPKGRFRHLTTRQLLELPPPSFLLEPFIVRDALNLLFGPSGTYKTFIALDWALSIASGRPWHGTRVTQGPVLYIAGEGSGGIPKRIKAWASSHGATIPDTITWIPEAVPLRDAEAVQAVAEIVQHQPTPPALIVVETYARSLAGGNENSSEDGGRMIAALDELRMATGAAMLVTHHTGWEHTTRERGWSGLPAALDSSIRVSRPAPLNVTLHCQKAKDAEEFDPIHLNLVPHDGSLIIAKRVDPLEARDTELRNSILNYTKEHVGATTNAIVQAVSGKRKDILQTLEDLASEHLLRVETEGQRHHHFPTGSQPREPVGTGFADNAASTGSQVPLPVGEPVAQSRPQPVPESGNQ